MQRKNKRYHFGHATDGSFNTYKPISEKAIQLNYDFISFVSFVKGFPTLWLNFIPYMEAE